MLTKGLSSGWRTHTFSRTDQAKERWSGRKIGCGNSGLACSAVDVELLGPVGGALCPLTPASFPDEAASVGAILAIDNMSFHSPS